MNPDLVVHDNNGEIYTVRYGQVNAMLLNEFLKEHENVKDQAATIKELKRDVANLVAEIKEQAWQIQKLNVQVQRGNVVSQVALNNR